MKKKTIIAALAAAALTMGFSACSEKNAANYEMNVFLCVDHVSSDTAETRQIAETYIKALGIADKEEMTVKVAGKDSLDCVSTVAKKCAKAEKELEGQQWTDFSIISAYSFSEKSATELYKKAFGTADNDWDGTPATHTINIYLFGDDVKHKGGHAATSMHVQSQSFGIGLFSRSEWRKTYPYYCLMDMNEAAGGRYVYMMFGQENTSFKDLQAIVRENDHSEELNKYIADIVVLVSNSAIPDFKEFTLDGAKYQYAQGIYGDPVKWDLNYRAGGPYLYLFYSTDAVKFQRVIDIDECGIFSSNEHCTINDIGRGPWDVSKLVEAVKYDNGNVVFYGKDIDFNEGAGGAFIHMRADYISFEHLKNLSFDENGKAIYD